MDDDEELLATNILQSELCVNTKKYFQSFSKVTIGLSLGLSNNVRILLLGKISDSVSTECLCS